MRIQTQDEKSARGATIFLNSHLLAETEKVCSRAGILSKGRIVREGGLDELRRGGSRFRLKFSGVFDGSAAGLGVDAADPLALAAGARVEVAPDDTMRGGVQGELVALTWDGVTVRRSDPRCGDVHVHFPRIGYRVAALP